jgi:hypothetical protein
MHANALLEKVIEVHIKKDNCKSFKTALHAEKCGYLVDKNDVCVSTERGKGNT